MGMTLEDLTSTEAALWCFSDDGDGLDDLLLRLL
jgi:hypothetical protein